jgi:hypothetical protein
MQELELLNDKLDNLLKKYSGLQAENTRLKQTITQQTRSIEALNEKLSTLEQDIMLSNINKVGLSDEEKEGMKKQLDNVIGEIDKILSTLND